MVYSDLLRKKIYLLGEGKYLYDVRDFFCELNIKKAIAPVDINSYDIIDNPDKFLIVCDFENSRLKEDLQKNNLENGKNYMFLNALLAMTDEMETFYIAKRHFGKKIIAYGDGEILETLRRDNPNLHIDVFIQENSIASLRDIKRNSFYVIAAEEPNLETKHKFIDFGLKFGEDFHFFNSRTPKNLPSFYLERTIRDIPAYTMNCDYRTRGFSVKRKGFCMGCCSSIELGFGSLLHTSMEEMLKSVPARIIQLSIKNRTYSFCSDRCYMFRESRNKDREDAKVKGRNIFSEIAVKDINFQMNYDRSCNLACRSCREDRITKPEDSPEILDLVHEEMIEIAKQKPVNIRIGMGELFFSKYYKDILYNHYKNDSIAIITNGLLFNENNWGELNKCYKNISIEFSIDAAKEETYAYLRQGNFNALLKALELACSLRKNHELRNFTISFVVQNENFKEMTEFVELGRKFLCDRIYFRKINPFGHHNTEDFAKLDVYDKRNPNHSKFVDIVKNHIFREADICVQNINNFTWEKT